MFMTSSFAASPIVGDFMADCLSHAMGCGTLVEESRPNVVWRGRLVSRSSGRALQFGGRDLTAYGRDRAMVTGALLENRDQAEWTVDLTPLQPHAAPVQLRDAVVFARNGGL
jgi:hypothetical protein